MKKRKRNLGKKRLTYFAFLIGLFFILSCDNEEDTNKVKAANRPILRVAAAANVQFVIKEIEKKFEENYSADVDIIIGSSGKLTAQIEQGAPYDLFISANMKYPENLFKNGFAMTPPKVYALGHLVLWTMTDIKLEEDLTFLTKKNIKKIGIANPKNAPYGAEAINAFNYYKIGAALQTKLVYGESIAQTNQYVLSKTCEVGITAKSVVLAPKLQGKGKWIAINSAAYSPILQGVIITKYGEKTNKELANQFYHFLFSKKAAALFKKYGYSISN